MPRLLKKSFSVIVRNKPTLVNEIFRYIDYRTVLKHPLSLICNVLKSYVIVKIEE